MEGFYQMQRECREGNSVHELVWVNRALEKKHAWRWVLKVEEEFHGEQKGQRLLQAQGDGMPEGTVAHMSQWMK